jgi:hypothetical protein
LTSFLSWMRTTNCRYSAFCDDSAHLTIPFGCRVRYPHPLPGLNPTWFGTMILMPADEVRL